MIYEIIRDGLTQQEREKIEKNEKIELRNIARGFAKEKEVALKKEDAKEVFEQLEKENEHVQESPSLSE